MKDTERAWCVRRVDVFHPVQKQVLSSKIRKAYRVVSSMTLPGKQKVFFVLFSFSLFFFFFFVFLVKKKCVVGQMDNEGYHEIHTKKKHQRGNLITETNGDS
ncbi:hypothetical protein K445DRAFT_136524 [Daldinia sp. EC12]|nr:hypothetical protein K445DRAFT_136524 [Daldinia sp. EC12]